MCFLFIANEGLSILENLGLMGVPYPAFLRNMLEALRKSADKGCPRPFVDDPKAWAAFKKRLEVDGITEEQVRGIAQEAAREAVAAAMPQVYTSIPEVPEWARGLVQQAMATGALHGDQNSSLHLTDANLVNLQMFSNLGLLGK